MAEACEAAGCALLGGETAEMPGVYSPGAFDIAGTLVGVVEQRDMLPRGELRVGDALIAVASNGPHTNGYSLLRRIFEWLPMDSTPPGFDRPLGETLLVPHRSYLDVLAGALASGRVKALAHITGGGLPDNLPRVLPDDCDAVIELGSWPVPPLFRLVARGRHPTRYSRALPHAQHGCRHGRRVRGCRHRRRSAGHRRADLGHRRTRAGNEQLLRTLSTGAPAMSRLVVLASGTGTNLQAILDACGDGRLPADVAAVISNKAGSQALQRAADAGVPFVHVAPHADEQRSDYDARLADIVSGFDPDWVVLAGWMRVLSMSFLGWFPGMVVNLHPALPGELPGIDAIERAWQEAQAGHRDHTGVMVHLVPDEGVDDGPVLATATVFIHPSDTLESLTDRVHAVEHRLLVETLATLCTTGANA